MRTYRLILSVLLAALPTLPALSSNLIRPIRTGTGQPRTRDSATAASAAQRTQTQPVGAGVTRTYQPAKPGEGAPKG